MKIASGVYVFNAVDLYEIKKRTEWLQSVDAHHKVEQMVDWLKRDMKHVAKRWPAQRHDHDPLVAIFAMGNEFGNKTAFRQELLHYPNLAFKSCPTNNSLLHQFHCNHGIRKFNMGTKCKNNNP